MLGQELLHHFCASPHPRVCPHPELREDCPLQQLHPGARSLCLPSGWIAQVGGRIFGQKAIHEIKKREWSKELATVLTCLTGGGFDQ